jgi:DNA-binding NtrC family response regulator
MADTGDDQTGPSLVVVTTDQATARELSAWLERQLPDGRVAVRTGFYAAMTAFARSFDVVVADIGLPASRDVWRLAEVRNLAPDATVIVVADTTFLPRLVGPLRPDLAVRSVADLPPLRELMTGPAAIDDQTMRRRSRR